MKNYYLILGGIGIGMGLSFLAENLRLEKVKNGEVKEPVTNYEAAFSLIGGIAVIGIAIYGLDK